MECIDLRGLYGERLRRRALGQTHDALVPHHAWRRGTSEHRLAVAESPSRRDFFQLAAVGQAMLPITRAEGIAQGSEHRYSFDASDGVTIDRKEQVITSDLSRVIKSDADRRVGKRRRYRCDALD
jgi:hypothetical protein